MFESRNRLFNYLWAQPSRSCYLPLPESNSMAGLANYLAKREAEMPLRPQMKSWPEATKRETDAS